jgi:23S rRNA (uracil1939-C5)-methyltransferase
VTESGEHVALAPQGMSYRGTAVGRIGGQVIFVAGALPGESVIAEIERRHKNFLEGRAVEIVEASPERVAPRCGHFPEAGSCEWEFISYDEQLRLKTSILRDQLQRVGKFPEPPLLAAVPSPSAWGYRNHVHFAIAESGGPAYLRRGSHETVPVDSCAVIDPRLDALLPRLQGRLTGLRQIELRCGTNSGEMLVAPSLGDRVPELENGQPHYHEEVMGRRFRISAGSFFQVNTAAAEQVTRLVIDSLAGSGSERLADLYAGVGLFACLLANSVQSVVAVESDPEAVEDGRLNAGFLENVRYRKGRVEEVLPRLRPAPDAVVLDPPRAGCNPRVLAALIEAPARQIVYCSCDAATLARDLRVLVDGGYRLASSRVVDMFPQTYHIESVTVLDSGS